jgi:hypothetical protein
MLRNAALAALAVAAWCVLISVALEAKLDASVENTPTGAPTVVVIRGR